MARNRLQRRRRVFNEEVLTAGSALGIAARAKNELADVPGDTPRYGAGANIENHPQITDYVPRRYRTILLLLGAGVALGIGGELVARFAQPISAQTSNISAAEISNTLGNGLIAWASSVALLIAACFGRLVYSLRRHLVDDSNGRYRIWRTATWVAIALSANAVLGAHVLLAELMGQATGWNLLPNHAGWWLVPAAALGGTLLVKLALNSAECRATFTAYSLAIICFATAGVLACGWYPQSFGPWLDTLSRLLPLTGNLLMMSGTLLFARYVVLDVQGLIDHGDTSSNSVRDSAPEKSESASHTPPQMASADADDTDWVDGSEAEFDQLEDDRPRHLSKAERKRLRKQKGRHRAA